MSERIEMALPRNPERKEGEEVEHLEAVFEEEYLPRSAEAFAEQITDRGTELRHAELDDLSDEALFLDELRNDLREFQSEKGIEQLDRITFDRLALIAQDGQVPENANTELLREIHDYLKERYVLTAEDVVVRDENGYPQPSESSETALAELTTGARQFWQKVYRAVLKQEYEQRFPERLKGAVDDMLWADSHEEQQAMLERLAQQAGGFKPVRINRLLRTLYEEVNEPLPEHRKFIDKDQVRELFKTLATQFDMPDDQAPEAHAEKVATQLNKLIYDDLPQLQKLSHEDREAAEVSTTDLVTPVLDAFRRHINQPAERLLEPDDLFDGEALLATLKSFTPVQRQLFYSGIRERYIEPYGFTNDHSQSLLERMREARHRRFNIDNDDAAAWAEQLAVVLNERMTEPPEEAADDDEEDAEVVETTPADILNELRSRKLPERKIDQVVDQIMSLSENDKRALYNSMREYVVQRNIFSYLNQRLGRDPSQAELNNVPPFIESQGVAGNKDGWRVFCMSANSRRLFRQSGDDVED